MTDRKSAGFTLLEILITLILIGIITGMAVLAIHSWMPRYYLKAAARDIKSQILLCKMRAVKDNCSCEIRFATTTHLYRVQNASGCTNTYSEIVNLTNEYRGYAKFGDSGYGRVAEDSGGTSSAGATFAPFEEGEYKYRAVFQSNGRPSQAGGVYLKNDRGQAYAIYVTLAGGVRIYRWNGGWKLQ